MSIVPHLFVGVRVGLRDSCRFSLVDGTI